MAKRMNPREDITHFYHVYADGHWQEPVREHVDVLIHHRLPIERKAEA